MKKALLLAEKGGASVSPNPKVGACIVKRGSLVGEGYHAFFGGPHAEISALKRAGARARGATLYVTLEPCSSWGKTPPCVQAVIQAGISRVVVAMLDPNSRNYRKGIESLKRAKISVTTGVLENEARRQNEAFIKWVKTGMPFVTLKMAQSLDGKIAATGGRSRWISGRTARQFVHKLREDQDAIMVGKQTALVDNPRLSPGIRKGHKKTSKPWRVAIDPDYEIPSRGRIFQGEQLTLRVVSEKTAARISFKKQQPPGSQNILVVPSSGRRIKFLALLKQLGSLGVARLLVEGGGETAWSLLSQRLVDRIFWIIAPKFIGGRQAISSVEGPGVTNPNRAFRPEHLTCRPLGEDWLFEGNF